MAAEEVPDCSEEEIKGLISDLVKVLRKYGIKDLDAEVRLATQLLAPTKNDISGIVLQETLFH